MVVSIFVFQICECIYRSHQTVWGLLELPGSTQPRFVCMSSNQLCSPCSVFFCSSLLSFVSYR